MKTHHNMSLRIARGRRSAHSKREADEGHIDHSRCLCPFSTEINLFVWKEFSPQYDALMPLVMDSSSAELKHTRAHRHTQSKYSSKHWQVFEDY